MKKLLILITLVFAQKLQAQMTLEGTYTASPGTSFVMLIQLDSADYKYARFNTGNEQFTLYNLNHSLFMTINIPVPFIAPDSMYSVAYVTRSLFDCDTSNIEYMLSYYGNANFNSYPKKTYLIRTNGTILQTIDSAWFMNNLTGWTYGAYDNKPVVNTPTGAKLLLRHFDGSSKVYSLCGYLPCGVCGNGETMNGVTENTETMMGLPYPNPTTSIITIPYALPANENMGTLKIYDITGKEIRSYTVDRSFTSITLSTSELASGTYYYQLYTPGGTADVKKVIKVK